MFKLLIPCVQVVFLNIYEYCTDFANIKFFVTIIRAIVPAKDFFALTPHWAFFQGNCLFFASIGHVNVFCKIVKLKQGNYHIPFFLFGNSNTKMEHVFISSIVSCKYV